MCGMTGDRRLADDGSELGFKIENIRSLGDLNTTVERDTLCDLLHAAGEQEDCVN
jgi:hypothetical protein